MADTITSLIDRINKSLEQLDEGQYTLSVNSDFTKIHKCENKEPYMCIFDGTYYKCELFLNGFIQALDITGFEPEMSN